MEPPYVFGILLERFATERAELRAGLYCISTVGAECVSGFLRLRGSRSGFSDLLGDWLRCGYRLRYGRGSGYRLRYRRRSGYRLGYGRRSGYRLRYRRRSGYRLRYRCRSGYRLRYGRGRGYRLGYGRRLNLCIRVILRMLSLLRLLVRDRRQLGFECGLAVLWLVGGVVVGVEPGALSYGENGFEQDTQDNVADNDIFDYRAKAVNGRDALCDSHEHEEHSKRIIGHLHNGKRQEALTIGILHELTRAGILCLRSENLPVKQDSNSYGDNKSQDSQQEIRDQSAGKRGINVIHNVYLVSLVIRSVP